MNKSNLIIWGILKKIIAGMSIILFCYFFIGAPMLVSGDSMFPNLHDRDAALINKFIYMVKAPERGDIVVFRFPGTRTDLYVKRIIGLPHETVEIKNNAVYVNGNLISEVYIDQPTQSFTYPKVILGDNEYFVSGDNRAVSNDSRYWGALDKKFIIGKLDLIFWPPGRAKALITPVYNY
jgi:signal peptidase I